MTERAQRLATNMRQVAGMCGGNGAEVYVLGFLRSYAAVDAKDAGAALVDAFAALDLVNAEKEADDGRMRHSST